MVFGCSYFPTYDGDCLYGLRFTLGSKCLSGGATVITNLVSAIPVAGPSIVEWLWGGFSVDNATLNRFFSIHYLLPFAITGLVIVHIALLHKDGSNNPLGIDSSTDKIPFYPYCYVKDLFNALLFVVFFSVFLFFYPNLLGHPDNYIPANPMVTPAHIVPEWVFPTVFTQSCVQFLTS